MILEDRILLHLQDGRRIPVDPQEIYLLEAEGGETLVRTRHAQTRGMPATAGGTGSHTWRELLWGHNDSVAVRS